MSTFHTPEAFRFCPAMELASMEAALCTFLDCNETQQGRCDVQVNSLLYAMGKQAEPIFSTFTFSVENVYYNTVVKTFDEHFVSKRNLIQDHACFHKRSQGSGKSVKAFVSSCEV